MINYTKNLRRGISLASNRRAFTKKKVLPQIRRNTTKTSQEKTVQHDTTPPPPPPGSGGSNFYLAILLGAVVGGAYYFKDDINEKLGFQKIEAPAKESVASAVTSAAPSVPEMKQVVKKAEVTIAPVTFPDGKVDYDVIAKDLADLLDSDESQAYEDGSYGPVWVRLAWHNAGTYDKGTKLGGSEGAAMRYKNEAEWGANAGLHVARETLEPVKSKYPQVSYSDLWSLAGTVAIEEMGGPEIVKVWRPGRKDKTEEEDAAKPLPDGLLPDADGREHKENPQQHVRDIFYRMGFNDRDIVALCGAHALGRCHEDRSGYWGPWTRAPTTFSNEYFRLLIEETWTKKKTHNGKEWTGPEQYETPDGELMMLPADMSLVWDPEFKKYVEMYAKDEDLFFADFAKAWMKLQEVGVKQFNGWKKYIFFGERV